MYLDEIQRLYDYAQDKYKKNNILLVAAQVEIYNQVIGAIATGQCKDYPPEDFAQELLRVFKHEIQ